MEEFEEVLSQSQALNNMLLDVSKKQDHSLSFARKMMVILVICFTIIECTSIVGFFWYESQFTTISTTTETKDINVTSEGDSANAEYNEINQGKDSEVNLY